MKTLLNKEFKFTAIGLTYIFLLASFLAFLPGYPILCAPFFVCLGIFYTFQLGREGNDVLYTALLPVKKTDVVKARYLFVVTLEIISFIILVAITIFRMIFLADALAYTQNALMNANLMYLGFSLLVFSAYNVFFVGGYWKDAYKIGIPFLKSGIAMLLLIFIAESIHFLPGMEEINAPTGFLSIQLLILAVGAIVFPISTLLSCKASMKNFNRLDLHL